MADRVPVLFRLGRWLQERAVARAEARRVRRAFSGRTAGRRKAAGSDNVITFTGTTWDPERGLFGESGRYSYRWAATEGYGKNELVYAVISDIAESAAEPTMRVYGPDGEELVEHPARELMASPNSLMTEFELFELVLLHLSLAGNAFWLKVRSRAGRVVELWPVWIPSRMCPAVDEGGRLVGWLYTDNDGGRHGVDLEDVVHFKYPHPLNPWLGLAPMAVAVRAVTRDNSATDFVNSFFANAAVPQGLLKFKRRVEQGEADRVRELWRARYGGSRGWFDVAVLDADTEYERLGLTSQEMAMPELNQLNESRITMIFKWPAILIGAMVGLEHGTYSNFQEARRVAWEDTLSPIYKRLQDRVNHDLAPEFGWLVAAAPFRWDFSAVSALREDVDARAERFRKGYVVGAVTRNEYREQLGEEPDSRGDVYLVNPNLVLVPQGGENQESANQESANQELGDGEGEPEQVPETGKVFNAYPVWKRLLRGD